MGKSIPCTLTDQFKVSVPCTPKPATFKVKEYGLQISAAGSMAGVDVMLLSHCARAPDENKRRIRKDPIIVNRTIIGYDIGVKRMMGFDTVRFMKEQNIVWYAKIQGIHVE